MGSNAEYALGYAKASLADIRARAKIGRDYPDLWRLTLREITDECDKTLRVVEELGNLGKERTDDSKEHGVHVQHPHQEG